MDIFEYNEVRWPTRALQQEEEEQAVERADQSLLLPEIKWSQGGNEHIKPKLLVVTMSPASSALLVAALGPAAKEVGHVAGHTASTQQQQPSSNKTEAPAVLYAPLPDVLVCCCSSAVAPERAGAWARGVLQQVQPQRVLLLGSMQAEQYRGEADASQELLAFLLRSTPLRQQHEQSAAAQQAIPYLPSGSIVSGLPAALLTHAELTGLPAELLVVVDQVPSLVPETLKQLAQLVVGCLQSAMGAGGQPGSAAELAWAASLAKGAVVDAARLKLQRTAYRPSSVYS